MRFSENTIDLINEQEPTFLDRDRSGKGYCCLDCSSGRGKKGTGITDYRDGNGKKRYKCHVCGANENVIGLWQKNTGDDFIAAVNNLSAYYGITAETTNEPVANKPIKKEPVPENTEKTDYREYFKACKQNLDQAKEYLSLRGISIETASRFNIGYDANWRHPKAPDTVPTSPRLIIPTSSHSYLARDTRPELKETQKKYSKSKVGDTSLYTFTTTGKDTPVYVVEGEIDALSFKEIGCNAIALGSTSMKNRAVDFIAANSDYSYILALDNDPSGQKTTTEIVDALKEKGIAVGVINPYGAYKDANEVLVKDREHFENTVKPIGSIEDANDIDYRLRNAVAYKMQSFYESIMKAREKTSISTGFRNLDSLLGGGLYSGLYCIGAISSLGKTTFMLQLMDNVAKSGKDVLIFSLEMASQELMAKSVSRLTLELSLRDQNETKVNRLTSAHAKTTRSILNGKVMDEPELIGKALNEYSKYAEHIFITEGVGNVGIAEVKEKVQRHIEVTGRKPVILIDYLQILAPTDPRFTDKQNTDLAVLELKRLSRDFDIPVLAISSFNRMSYNEPVNMTSFKESGAIEFSSDVLLALQYWGMDYQDGEKEKDRDKRIRTLIKTELAKANNCEEQELQLKVLKNRNGKKGDCRFNFTPMFNRFNEVDEFNTTEYEQQGITLEKI